MYGGIEDTLVLLPKSWDHKAKLSVAIWLHGYGADPSTLSKDAHYQETADALGIAIVGIPATHQLGANSYEWREEPDADLAQVNRGLQEAHQKILTDIGSSVTYREVPGMKKHGRPPDWPEKFRTWTGMLLSVAP